MPGPASRGHVCELWLGHDPGQGSGGGRRVETSLFPKDGRYVVPVKADVRKAVYLEDGDSVTMRLSIRA